jgi:hypothetical protein
MSETIKVKVADIVTLHRKEREPLPEGLPQKVYSLPVILRGDMVLVDGVRRLQRARDRGQAEITAIVSSDYPTLINALRAQNGSVGNEPPPRRLWEMYNCVFSLGITWSRGLYNGGWEKLPNGQRQRRAKGSTPPSQGSIRKMFVGAFTYSNTMVGHIANVYRQSDGGNVYAVELANAVDRGEISPQAAAHRLYRPYNMTGNITNEEDQRRLLQRGASGLEAQMSALMKLGWPIQVGAEELQEFYDSIYATRTKLTEMINGLKKMIKETQEEEAKRG